MAQGRMRTVPSLNVGQELYSLLNTLTAGANVIGQVFNIAEDSFGLPKSYSWEVLVSGTISTLSVDLLGSDSIDKTGALINPTVLDTWAATGASGLRFIINKPVNYIAARPTTFTGSGNVTVGIINNGGH